MSNFDEWFKRATGIISVLMEGRSDIMSRQETIPIESSFLVLRGQRVILAADLAKSYGVETRTLNQAVKRNRERFPRGFHLSFDPEEAAGLSDSRSQSVILKRGHNIKYLPYGLHGTWRDHGGERAQ
jgi:hypothetical protein